MSSPTKSVSMMKRDVKASRAEKMSMISEHFAVRLTIKQDDRSLRIDGPRKGDPCLLTTTQCDSLFSNLGLVAVLEEGKIRFETTSANNIPVSGMVVRLAKNDIILDAFRHAPTFLSGIADTALSRKVKERARALFKVKFTSKGLKSVSSGTQHSP